MLDRSVVKAAGGLLMFGAVLGLVANLMHPQLSDPSPREELELVADSGIWLIDHFLIAWTGAFLLVGLVAIGWSYAEPRAAAWGRFAIASGIVGVGILFLTALVDGMAVKDAADAWAANPDDPAIYGRALAVMDMQRILFTGIQGSIFGLTPVLFGVAGLMTDEHPKWLAWLVLVAGVVGLLSGSIQYLAGVSRVTADVLFPIASIAFTAWAFIMGLRLWKGSPAQA